MDSRRLLAVAAVLAVAVIVGFAASQNSPQKSSNRPTPAPTLTENCLKVPSPVKAPAWYPSDLPMPAGSFPIDEPKATSGLRRVIFAAKGDLRAFVLHALGEWKRQGWTLGRGESEPGEAEDNFLKGERYGIFRAQTVFCDPAFTWVLVVVNDPSVKATPTIPFNRRGSGSPSPLTSPG